jgi:hypothetical protein
MKKRSSPVVSKVFDTERELKGRIKKGP